MNHFVAGAVLLLGLPIPVSAQAQLTPAQDSVATAMMLKIIAEHRAAGDSGWTYSDDVIVSIGRRDSVPREADSLLVAAILGPEARLSTGFDQVAMCPLERDGTVMRACVDGDGVSAISISRGVYLEGTVIFYVVYIGRFGPGIVHQRRGDPGWSFRLFSRDGVSYEVTRWGPTTH